MAKKDDRRDNVERIQENIDNTFENMREAENMFEASESEVTRKELKDKNQRRKKTIDGLRNEIKDEYEARKNDYK